MLKINGLIAISLFGLSACGGGSGGSTTPAPVILSGVFKDSNVTGLSYVSGAQKGITDLKGKFAYEDGKDVAFSIGKVELGSAVGQAVMTPLDLVANGQVATTEVVNRVRFLMMLDKDNTPSNGIEISKKVQTKAIDWSAVDFSAADFLGEVSSIIVDASVEDGVSHSLPDAQAAMTHLKTTLLCSFAGAYVGEYSGTETGNIALMVDPVMGNVLGSSYNLENQVSVVVNSVTEIDYDNNLEFESSEDSSKKFTGKLDSTDKLQGTWVNTSNAQSTGDFSASRLGGISTAVYRYSASFTGGDKGLYTFDVAADNKVSGTSYSVSSKKESALTGTLLNNVLKVTTADGTEIDGIVDETTLAMSGVWSNVSALEAGNFTGGGCKLN